MPTAAANENTTRLQSGVNPAHSRHALANDRRRRCSVCLNHIEKSDKQQSVAPANSPKSCAQLFLCHNGQLNGAGLSGCKATPPRI